MCYELGSWYRKVRGAEAHKVHEQVDEARRAAVNAPLEKPQPVRPQEKESEKMPA